ncbi:MAG: phosphate acyltransferase PlsX [Phycisphaera sp.]|nr:phosphate acyltransferase PlsX [Phycisphaera sp.]
MRIAVDVMGGDHAPDAILTGSLDAIGLLSESDRLVLIGDGAVIREELEERGLTQDPRIEVEATTQVIGMDESPVLAIRNKPDSSIVRMGELGGSRKSGERHCEVVISAGNTGACVAAAQMAMRRLPGVNRPGIAVTIPTFYGPVIICDVGANPEPKPHHLHQYGHMAGVYASKIIGIEKPRIALLNIGSEEAKGSPLVKETAKQMRKDPTINYVGFVEGRDLFDGKADVVVTEGFTGNVVLKLAEGLAAGLFKTIAHEIFEIDPELAMKFEPVVKSIYAKHDYHEYGGAPLLGANGICVICHGSSEARTIKAAIRNAIKYVKLGVNDGIVTALANAPAPEEPVASKTGGDAA